MRSLCLCLCVLYLVEKIGANFTSSFFPTSTYGHPCTEECRLIPTKGFYTCPTPNYKMEGKFKNWDFCSPTPGKDFKGRACSSLCIFDELDRSHRCHVEGQNRPTYCSSLTQISRMDFDIYNVSCAIPCDYYGPLHPSSFTCYNSKGSWEGCSIFSNFTSWGQSSFMSRRSRGLNASFMTCNDSGKTWSQFCSHLLPIEKNLAKSQNSAFQVIQIQDFGHHFEIEAINLKDAQKRTTINSTSNVENLLAENLIYKWYLLNYEVAQGSTRSKKWIDLPTNWNCEITKTAQAVQAGLRFFSDPRVQMMAIGVLWLLSDQKGEMPCQFRHRVYLLETIDKSTFIRVQMDGQKMGEVKIERDSFPSLTTIYKGLLHSLALAGGEIILKTEIILKDSIPRIPKHNWRSLTVSSVSSPSSSLVQPFVVGGTSVWDEAEIPYQAQIRVTNLTTNIDQLQCGGVVYKKYFILTAAHCLYDRYGHRIQNQQFTVIVGTVSNNFLRQRVGRLEQRKTVVDSFHPIEYNPGGVDYDVAVLKLQWPLKLGFIKSIPLRPKGSDTSSFDPKMTVSGWGSTHQYGGGVSHILQQAKLGRIDNTLCQTLSDAVGQPPTQITERMMCSLEAQKDACRGDSGGPLTCYTKKDKNIPNLNGRVLCGLVSFGIKGTCAEHNIPGVYVDVSNPFIHNWITRTAV